MSKHNWQPLPYHPRNTNKYDRNYLNRPILTHHHQPLLSPEVMVMVVVMVIVIYLEVLDQETNTGGSNLKIEKENAKAAEKPT